MTKPKKWFLVEEDGVTLHNKDGPICKPNAPNSLGVILGFFNASEKLRGEKYNEEAVVLVSCLHSAISNL